MSQITCCPQCQGSRNSVIKRRFIYPKLLFGLPIFWPHVNPTLARLAVLIIVPILAVFFAWALFGTLINGELLFALLLIVGVVVLAYIARFGWKAIHHHKTKVYYVCEDCKLEWEQLLDE